MIRPQSSPIRATALALLVLACAVAGNAATFVVPPDDEMIDDAHAIVIGTVGGMHSEFASNRDIVTKIDISVDGTLKTHSGIAATITLRELGGAVGEQFMAVSGSPTYFTGNRVLLFLERGKDGSWRTYGLSLGKFDFGLDGAGREIALRWAHERDVRALKRDGSESVEPLRDAAKFIAYIRARVASLPAPPRAPLPVALAEESAALANPEYVVEAQPDELRVPLPLAGHVVFPPSAYMQGAFRWPRFDLGESATFFSSGSQPGYDAIGAAQRALAAWTSDPDSNVDFRYGGTNAAAFVQDTVNTIVFNNSTDIPVGAIAYAKWYGSGDHTYKGEMFFSTIEGDVVVKSGISVSQKVFDEAITHELGHTLGFRHSDQGTPSSVEAVMKATLSGNYGATLGPWDIEAVRVVYGSSASTVPQVSFTDDPLVPRVTIIKALHFNELRAAVNSFRTAAGLTAATWSEAITPGVVVKAIHINELRSALQPALTFFGRPTSFAETVTSGTLIKASHVQELRDRMK